MQEIADHGNAVNSYDDDGTLVIGSYDQTATAKQLRFDDAEEARRLADAMEVGAPESGKADFQLNGHELNDLRSDRRDDEVSADIGETRFTVNVEQLREAADAFEDFHSEPTIVEQFEDALARVEDRGSLMTTGKPFDSIHPIGDDAVVAYADNPEWDAIYSKTFRALYDEGWIVDRVELQYGDVNFRKVE